VCSSTLLGEVIKAGKETNAVCRPFQEVDMEPLVGLDLPHLEHLELRAQNEAGFGPRQLEPLARAKMPSLK
jgi:hypothetical protein